MNINVLSLFDGISCGQIALERSKINVKKYFASEIDKNAIKVTQCNYPNTIQLGSVLTLDLDSLPQIDLLIGGSPCQGFSIAGKQLNFSDPRSKLFFNYVEVLEYLQFKNNNLKFLLENVCMKKEIRDIISKKLGVDYVEINSSLVSAQNRPRLYWTNIAKIDQPKDKNIKILDIIDDAISKYEFVHTDIYENGRRKGNCWQYDGSNKNHDSQNYRAYFLDNKMCCLRAGAPHSAKILTNLGPRKTTRNEHERLQTLPDNYTSSVSLNKAKSLIGNGWTVDIISHIFNYLPNEWKKQ